MTIRTKAIMYLREQLRRADCRRALGVTSADLRRRPSPVAASRFFPPAESWTARAAWAITIAESKLDGTGKLIFLCERESGDGFHVLGVPREWLRDRAEQFAHSHGQCRLFLSAEAGELFTEVRGTGSVDFTGWVVDSA